MTWRETGKRKALDQKRRDETNEERRKRRFYQSRHRQREPKLSGRGQRYVRRVLLSGIKKRFVVRLRGKAFPSVSPLLRGGSGCGSRLCYGVQRGACARMNRRESDEEQEVVEI